MFNGVGPPEALTAGRSLSHFGKTNSCTETVASLILDQLPIAETSVRVLVSGN